MSIEYHSDLKDKEKKERTLLAAWLLAAWSPLIYGIAVIYAESTLMFADLLRRSGELAALFIAWYVFRQAIKYKLSKKEYNQKARKASIFLGVIMILSFFVIVYRAIMEYMEPSPVAQVIPGIVIAFLGICVNGWFWRRYRVLMKQGQTLMFDSQMRLFRSKTLIDTWVVMSLSLTQFIDNLSWAVHIDLVGSLVVGVVILISALQILKQNFNWAEAS